ncbi:unnamed protein product [Nezara viridula]|uniref:Uncharacterized protein n=1 Tax=Nezara viridula TaxID=85310 RepID=A0A9P0HMF2_NEZVI|nr:unnamed protein product [Nezara viridula]
MKKGCCAHELSVVHPLLETLVHRNPLF